MSNKQLAWIGKMCLGRYAKLKEQKGGRNREENVSKTEIDMVEPQLGGSGR